MPVISRFYGMTIKMYLLGKEHNPPHIHALYGDYNGVIDIQTLDMIEGDLPRKALNPEYGSGMGRRSPGRAAGDVDDPKLQDAAPARMSGALRQKGAPHVS